MESTLLRICLEGSVNRRVKVGFRAGILREVVTDPTDSANISCQVEYSTTEGLETVWEDALEVFPV
jgi:hypothetical protein